MNERVCVCVCVCERARASTSLASIHGLVASFALFCFGLCVFWLFCHCYITVSILCLSSLLIAY